MKFSMLFVGVCAALFSLPCNAQPEVVILPTLESDHQFNLDYTVAHLMALLDTISPDAVVASDATAWLRNACPWQAIYPENHMASVYARERSLPIFGILPEPGPYDPEAAERSAQEYNDWYKDPERLRNTLRWRLDSGAAGIARNYGAGGRSPEAVVRLIRSKASPQELRTQFAILGAAPSPPATLQQIADEISRLTTTNGSIRRWAIMQRWEDAVALEDILRQRRGIKVLAVDEFLPLKASAVDKRLNYANTAWILSGVLDEWYSMWAPQAFPTERIAGLLARLKRLAPKDDPVTRFLEARWLMQNRDYRAAKPILQELAAKADDARFPFPVNGKWIRPPWNSVRDKAKLNLAFVYDYQGDRGRALVLYRELLDKGRLNDEAYAMDYVFDDIRRVIEDYVRNPYTGMPEEAFRHIAILPGVPTCAPAK